VFVLAPNQSSGLGRELGGPWPAACEVWCRQPLLAAAVLESVRGDESVVLVGGGFGWSPRSVLTRTNCAPPGCASKRTGSGWRLPHSQIFQATTPGATVVIPAAGTAGGGSLKAWSTRHFSPSSKR
jgi:hypothetical protein